MTRNVDAIRRLFQVDPAHDRTPLLPGIYPDYPAPIVRRGSGGLSASGGEPHAGAAFMQRQPAQLTGPREAVREPFRHWHIVILRNMGTAFMPLRRLIVWIGLGPRQPVPPATPDVDWEGTLDLVEFGRLLGSGKSEDLKKIAQAMTLSKRAFEVLPPSRFGHTRRPNFSQAERRHPWYRTPDR